MPAVLLSTPPAAPAGDLRAALAAAGFDVLPHAIGAPADFGAVAAAVVVAGPGAAAQLRLWRAELADAVFPVLAVAAEADAAPALLDAGADVCLARPFSDAHFVAQVRALARTRAAAARTAARADEARLLGNQLRQAVARLDADRDLARRVHRAALPAVPSIEGLTVSVSHRARSRADFHDVRRLPGGRLAFVVGDVPGRGGPAGTLLALLALRAAGTADEPDAVLAAVNRELLALRLDDPPLVALLAGTVDGAGTVRVARAGLPAPVWKSAGAAEAWSSFGPYLGTGDADYAVAERTLGQGERVLIATDAATLAAAVSDTAPDGDDVTLLVVERPSAT